MSGSAVAAVLVELARVGEEVISEAEAVNTRMNALSDAREARFEQRVMKGIPRWTPDPQGALINLRSMLAIDAARGHRDAAREFAAWWADVATIALVAIATDQVVSPLRVAIADPTIWLWDEELQCLPPVPDSTRQLILLAADMGRTPVGHEQADQDLASLAREHAARAGLKIGYADGQLTVTEDGTAEARRRRLWGDAWLEARVPLLPTAEVVSDLLRRCEASSTAVSAAVDAVHAVDAAVDAFHKMRALEQDESDDTAASGEDFDSLCDRAEQLTMLLGGYARTLTDTLCELHRKVAPGGSLR
jgi:hypothetical protein